MLVGSFRLTRSQSSIGKERDPWVKMTCVLESYLVKWKSEKP